MVKGFRELRSVYIIRAALERWFFLVAWDLGDGKWGMGYVDSVRHEILVEDDKITTSTWIPRTKSAVAVSAASVAGRLALRAWKMESAMR